MSCPGARCSALALLRRTGTHVTATEWVPALRSSVKNAAPRPGHETEQGATNELHERRLFDQDSQQRESERGPPGAESAGRLAPRLYGLVERHGAGRLSAVAGVSAHRLFGRSARLGQVRLRQDAGISLGHSACAAGGKSRHSLRRELWQTGLAGS